MRRHAYAATLAGSKGEAMTAVVEHEPTLREQAISQLEHKREFHRHLTAYVMVNGLLWLVWGLVYAAGGTWFPWPVFPMMGWGIGLTFHAWQTYRSDFSERTIRREMDRIRGETE
jgi:hypothetical protein